MKSTKTLSLESNLSDQEYRELLEEIRWQSGFSCPRCSHDRGYWIQTRRLYQCKKCSLQTSATSNTAFHGIRNLRAFIGTLFTFLQPKPIPATKISTRFEIRYHTGWTTMHRIRKNIAPYIVQPRNYSHVSCELLKEALTKSSSCHTAVQAQNADLQSEAALPSLVYRFIFFLIVHYRGVSQKYAQNYAVEFSFRKVARKISPLCLLEAFIRGSPITAKEVSGTVASSVVYLV